MGERVNSLIIRMIYLMVVAIVGTQMIAAYRATSYFFAVLMALTVCFWINRAFVKIDALMFWALAISILAVTNVLCNALVNYALFSLSRLTKLFSLVLALLYFSVVVTYDGKTSTINFILRINTLLSVCLMVAYLLFKSQMYLMNGIVTKFLTFRFNNPNLTALFLLCNCMLAAIRFFRETKKFSRILYFVIFLCMAFFVIETASRNCILALAVFCCVFLLAMVSHAETIRMQKWVALLLAVLPILFVGCYMLLVSRGLLYQLFGFLSGTGKPLESRVTVWNYALHTFLKSPIIGAFFQLFAGSNQFHMHNSHIDILAYYGIIVFVLFCVFQYLLLTRTGCNKTSAINHLSRWAFGVMLLTGIGEAAIFSGGLGIYAYSGVFLLLANHNFEEQTI